MNETTTSESTKLAKIIVSIAAILFSFVALILVQTEYFVTWYIGSPSYYASFYWGHSYMHHWLKLFLFLLTVVFLVCLAVSVFLLLNALGKLKIKLPIKRLGILGIIAAVLSFATTILTLIVVAIYSIGIEWWPDASFYSSIVGSILVGIFSIIYTVLESSAKSAKN